MARKNIFSKVTVKEQVTDQIKQSLNHQVCQSSTLDNLPNLDLDLELPISNSELIIKCSENTHKTVVIDLAQKIDVIRLSNEDKKGKLFLPWLHSLYTSNPTDAIYLLRINVKFLMEAKVDTHKAMAFNWLSAYILKKGILIAVADQTKKFALHGGSISNGG